MVVASRRMMKDRRSRLPVGKTMGSLRAPGAEGLVRR